MEALAEANRQAYEGIKALAQRRNEILQEALVEWQAAMKDATGKDALAKNAERAKQGVQQAIDNFSELADMEAKTRSKAWKVAPGPLPGEPRQPAEAAASRSELRRRAAAPRPRRRHGDQDSALQGQRLHAGDGRGAAALRAGAHRASLEHVGSFSFDPGRCRQRRELHGRGPGADRPGRAASHQRRARQGRLLRPDGDQRGHARRELQPRHAPAERERRRQDDGRRQFMQRSPAFFFDDALQARDFGDWVVENFEAIKAAPRRRRARASSINIRQFAIGPVRNLRFNYTTGTRRAEHDRQGDARRLRVDQEELPEKARYILSGNMDTDKKHSRANMLLTRGKRVVAECTIKGDLLKSMMHTSAKDLFFTRQISNVGAFLAGSANNGAHAANGLTAMFIATGQDVANVSESHAGVTYAQLLDNGDYYWSITLTSLIVATYGGGTGLRRSASASR
jgi:hypothetical protein